MLMLDDLTYSHLQAGMSKQAVQALLGEGLNIPSLKLKHSETPSIVKSTLIYQLSRAAAGSATGKNNWLIVGFDDRGVSEWWIEES